MAPNGEAMPCHAASTIPGLEFPNVREHSLEWIWNESDAFSSFRGTDWMQEPCRSCPLGRQEEDFGGCRCQALRLAGDARATDPVCRFSPHHDRIVAARTPADADEFVYRTMKRPARSDARTRARAGRRDVAPRHGHGLARPVVHDQRQVALRAALDLADAGEVDEEDAGGRAGTRRRASSSSSLSMPWTAAWRRPSSVTSQTSLPSASA